jgi:hypothetical protein
MSNQTGNSVDNWFTWAKGIAAVCVGAGIIALVTMAHQTRETVTETSYALPVIRQDVANVSSEVQAVNDRMAQMISRPELEARLSETKVEMGQLRLEQQKIGLEIYKIQAEVQIRNSRNQ